MERTRTHRFLRFMFRVRPCIYFFGFQCLFATLIIILIVICCITINTKMIEVSRLMWENKILDERKDFISFFGCQYSKPQDYSTVSCSEDEDNYAFISRFYASISNDKRCVDRTDVLPCLSTDDVAKFNHTRLQNFTQCAGLNKIKLKHYITQSIPIIAPSINISQHQYRVLRVKDFMVRCPRCAIKSFFGWRDRANEDEEYAKPERCAREIKTFSPGWPQHARFCDEEQEHQVADFCRIHELLRDKLSVQMEQVIDEDYGDVIDDFGNFDDFY